jgi:hypothetical protein
MSKLPQADELPRTEEGIDPARVEEAFALFADRVRELEDVASELRAELQSLRAERAVRPAPVRYESEDWPAESGVGGRPPTSADWVATVPPPLARGVAVPRLALEGAFLILVAVLAGLADLAVEWIVLVMAGAWALVALAEWAAAAQRARWHLDEIAPAVPAPAAEAADSTGPWDMPVIQATAVAPQASGSESKTVVTTLPSEPTEEPEPEQAAEPEPEPARPRRRGLRRRKRPAETGAADPWEA